METEAEVLLAVAVEDVVANRSHIARQRMTLTDRLRREWIFPL